MYNKLIINFEKPKHGWLFFSISNNKKTMIKISASGVYNPFFEYVEILYDLKHNRKKIIEFFIDQEGFDSKITFKNKGLFIEIETETISSRKHHLPKQKYVFLKKQVIKEMQNKLLNIYKNNKKEMENNWYYFGFDKSKLIRL